jgi:hypothetical protein
MIKLKSHTICRVFFSKKIKEYSFSDHFLAQILQYRPFIRPFFNKKKILAKFLVGAWRLITIPNQYHYQPWRRQARRHGLSISSSSQVAKGPSEAREYRLC